MNARAIVAAAQRHPAFTKFLWLSTCVAIGLGAGDVLVALGYSL